MYQIQPAREQDVPEICRLIRPLSAQHLLLPRNVADVRAHLGGFRVTKFEGKIVAAAELRVLSPLRMAEILSLAVRDDFKGHGYEIALLEAIILEAGRLQIEKVFTVSHLTKMLAQVGFRIPASGERSILFSYPKTRIAPNIRGGGDRVEIRAARLEEMETILGLINGQAKKGHLLYRSAKEIEDLVLAGCAFVAVFKGHIIGHACLDIYNSNQAELRSLVVNDYYSGWKVATKLIVRVYAEAKSRGLTELMTVTNKVDLFLGLGFAFTSRFLTEALWVYPQKWKLR